MRGEGSQDGRGMKVLMMLGGDGGSYTSLIEFSLSLMFLLVASFILEFDSSDNWLYKMYLPILRVFWQKPPS